MPAMNSIGSGPATVASVLPFRRSMVACKIRVSDIEVRSITSPLGFITALNPVGAACSTHLPVSIARNFDEAIC